MNNSWHTVPACEEAGCKHLEMGFIDTIISSQYLTVL